MIVLLSKRVIIVQQNSLLEMTAIHKEITISTLIFMKKTSTEQPESLISSLIKIIDLSGYLQYKKSSINS